MGEDSFQVNEKTQETPSSASPISPTSTFDSGDAIIHINDAENSKPESIGPDIELASEKSTENDGSCRQWFSSIFKPSSSHTVECYETDCRILQECPEGYPRLGAFLSSERSWSIYRGFHYLHSRLLLNHQHRLIALEKELDDLDKIHDQTEEGQRRLNCKRVDERMEKEEEESRTRNDILNDIHKTLLEYDELLLKSRELVAFQKPSDRDYRSYRCWFKYYDTIVARETKFTTWKEDMVTLRQGRECAGFDGFVESTLQKLNTLTGGNMIRRMFCSPELRRKTNDKDIQYYSEERVNTLVGLIITTVIFILLVLPVVALYQMTEFGASSHDSVFRAVGVLIVFTLLFSASMSLLTRASRHELFAASAAYCAVLVVFISNFSNPQIIVQGSGVG